MGRRHRHHTHSRQLDKAACGLEYVKQPCWTVEELAVVRRQVDVRIAADESIRRADDPMRVAVAVIKCTPLGGVRRSLDVAEAAGLPCVVSSAWKPASASLPKSRSLLPGDVTGSTGTVRSMTRM